MINPQIGEIYKVRESPNYFMYVEIGETPEYFDQPENTVYVTTRTPYTTSVWGQIETAGFIQVDKLEPMRNNKKDREILKRIKSALEEGIKRSEVAYKLAKMRENRGSVQTARKET